MTDQVCAVTVTLNRRAILSECIRALRVQTYPVHRILVVNNDSTDDTCAWLEAQGDIQVLTQRNVGSAGGFRSGILAALAGDCDWFWLMDDDVLLEPNALEELVRVLRAHPETRVLNSLCLGILDKTRPCAGALRVRTDARDFLRGEYLYTQAQIRARADADGMLDSVGGQLYLGTLLHRSVVEKIGAPLAWFFTRGDEIEYALRMMKAGYPIWTVTSSIVYHPDTPITYVSVFGKKIPFEQMSPVKRYYSIRNSVLVRRAYYAGAPFLPYVVRRLTGALVTAWFVARKRTWRDKMSESGAALRGAWDGIRTPLNNPDTAQGAYGAG